VNCGLVRFATVEFAGVTAIETKGLATVRDAEPVIPAEVAEMVTVPGATAVARPPGELMEAMVLPEDCHFAVAVRSCVVLSANVPVAVNC
jgi:hypothetical protein